MEGIGERSTNSDRMKSSAVHRKLFSFLPLQIALVLLELTNQMPLDIYHKLLKCKINI